MSATTTRPRKSRAMDPEIKAMRALKRIVDGLEAHERQRVIEWLAAYVEGVGTSASARYGMALEAIILVKSNYSDDSKSIARKALGR